MSSRKALTSVVSPIVDKDVLTNRRANALRAFFVEPLGWRARASVAAQSATWADISLRWWMLCSTPTSLPRQFGGCSAALRPFTTMLCSTAPCCFLSVLSLSVSLFSFLSRCTGLRSSALLMRGRWGRFGLSLHRGIQWTRSISCGNGLIPSPY